MNHKLNLSKDIVPFELHTLSSLKSFNSISFNPYDRKHGLIDSDVSEANKLINLYNNKVNSKEFEIGDIIVLNGYNQSKKEEVTYNGHLEKVVLNESKRKLNDLNICTSPYVPHIHKSGITSTSGGYWINIPANKNKVRFLGYSKRMFWFWGWVGATADGGVYIELPVKVWGYKDLNNIY